MKRKNHKKLVLNRETIRELSDSKLGLAAGGGTTTRITCEPYSNCSDACTQTLSCACTSYIGC